MVAVILALAWIAYVFIAPELAMREELRMLQEASSELPKLLQGGQCTLRLSSNVGFLIATTPVSYQLRYDSGAAINITLVNMKVGLSLIHI